MVTICLKQAYVNEVPQIKLGTHQIHFQLFEVSLQRTRYSHFHRFWFWFHNTLQASFGPQSPKLQGLLSWKVLQQCALVFPVSKPSHLFPGLQHFEFLKRLHWARTVLSLKAWYFQRSSMNFRSAVILKEQKFAFFAKKSVNFLKGIFLPHPICSICSIGIHFLVFLEVSRRL